MSQKVSLWLEDLGLGKYSEVFEENEIGWDLLPELDQTTLKDIGVEIAGHRLRILKAVSTIDSNPQTEIVKAKPAIKVPDDATAWSRTPGERKPVTMLFADIVSSTHLTEQLDAEDAHRNYS